MRQRIFIAVGCAVLSSAGLAGPAGAHEGHASCQAAGQFAASQGQALGSDFGALASQLARAGQADDFVAGVHASLCDPNP
jgi:uncharacterized membrane protein